MAWTILARRVALTAVVLLGLPLGGCIISGDHDAELDQTSAAEDEPSDEMSAEAADPQAGDVVVLGGSVGGSFKFGDASGVIETSKSGVVEVFDAKKRKFAAAGKLAANRVAVPAIVVDGSRLDDQALLAGGMTGKADIKRGVLKLKPKALDKAEAYDPDDAKSKALPKKLKDGRAFHSETALADGRIVIIGGFDATGTPLSSVEIFDPADRSFRSAGRLLQTRAMHTATLLPNGQILVAGGIVTATMVTTPTAETYDARLGFATPTANRLQSPDGDASLAGHSATLVSGCGCAADGKVLLTGGFVSTGSGDLPSITSSTTTATLYDPATRTFTAAGVPQLHEERVMHSATLLPGGKILLAGGVYGQVRLSQRKIDGLFGGVHDSAEIFDGAANSMSCVGGGTACPSSLDNSRFGHAAVLISNGPLSGRVLLAGGAGGKKATQRYGAPLKTAELYDPDKDAFTGVGSMKAARIFPAAVLVE